MTTLVTGGCGFIGTHLVRHLLSRTDDDIRILDDLSAASQESVVEFEKNERVDLFEADIRDVGAVSEAAAAVDEIYHLAATLGVENVIENSLSSLEVNLRGTENVLAAAADVDASVFVASSSEVYGKSSDTPFAEDQDRVLGPTTVPRWGYAGAKAVDEFLALSYQRERDVPVVVGRYFNIVGPGQSPDQGMVIPTFVRQALDGRDLTVYGDGTQTRCFTHVQDAVEVTVELMEQNCYGEVFNVGRDEETTINRLAQEIVRLTETDANITHVPFDEVYGEDYEEPPVRQPDTTKLAAEIGTTPSTSLKQILEDAIAYYAQEENV